MSQIFSKSGNSFARATLVCGVIGLFGFWALGYALYRSPYTTEVNVPLLQPVPFSHQHHVAGAGLDRLYCHTTVEKSSFAGLIWLLLMIDLMLADYLTRPGAIHYIVGNGVQ